MLVKYRTNSSLTAANLMSDFNLIITGQVANVNSFSSGCDKGNTTIIGSYPAGVYNQVQANVLSGTFTYSKVHNDYADNTNYFRLVFSNTEPILNTIVLSKDFVSASNTMVNSQAVTKENLVHGVIVSSLMDNIITIGSFSNPDATLYGLNNGRSANLAYGDRIQVTYPYQSLVLPIRQTRLLTQISGSTGSTGEYAQAYSQRTATINYPCSVFRETSNLACRATPFNQENQITGIDIVVSDKCFFINWPSGGLCHGIFDLGKNGISTQFANSMSMASVDLKAEFAKIPLFYSLSSQSYGSAADIELEYYTPTRMRSNNQSITVIENPVEGVMRETGNPALSISLLCF